MHELHVHRGLLTGKFTREEVPTEGRLGWVAQNESRGSNSHPAWSKVKDNDQVWDVLDACKKMADAHGESGPIWVQLFIQMAVMSHVPGQMGLCVIHLSAV